MFSIPEDEISLMTDYKRLIFEGLKLKYPNADLDELHEMLIHELEPKKTRELSESIEDDFEVDLFFDPDDEEAIRYFVEERIGKDFLVFEDLETYVFCIHTADDFLTEIDRLTRHKLND